MEFEFRADREVHLRKLCAEMGRSVDDFVNEAVLTFMEDYEDGREAQQAMEEFRAGDQKTFTLDELMRDYGLEAGDLAESAQADRRAGQANQDSDPELSTKQASHAA